MPLNRAFVPRTDMLLNCDHSEAPAPSRSTLSAALERRLFRFAYPQPAQHGGVVLPHLLRDADAAAFLHAPLAHLGFVYAEPIINYPCARADARDGVPFDDSFLRAGDLLVLTTRPPLDDEKDGVKCHVKRSYTTLEEKVFERLRPHLTRCSRRQVIVSDALAHQFPGAAKFFNVDFKQSHGAPIRKFQSLDSQAWQRPPPGSKQSLAYLIYEEHVWPGGPALLASFGLCGSDTLMWNCLLARRFSQLICSTPFAMALLTAPRRASLPSPPGDIAQGWEVSLLTADVEVDMNMDTDH
jgi:hypothetical protein